MKTRGGGCGRGAGACLKPWLALLTLQALDQRRLLAANVRAAAEGDVDVEVDAAAARVLPQVARLP